MQKILKHGTQQSISDSEPDIHFTLNDLEHLHKVVMQMAELQTDLFHLLETVLVRNRKRLYTEGDE